MDSSDRKELRVILDNINVLNDEWFDTFPTDEGQTGIHDALEYEIVKADKILAKRPRQCDVGTPEEQEKRWHKNCGPGIPNCKHCKVYAKAKESGIVDDRGFLRCSCRFLWAQMPYADERKGEDYGK